ncbi:hypothetical protein DEO72_LG10g2323 [Vigna unguiculata]|uniref:Uncharacterized protein n=1 Tax=Vigna unguiculata TaxID=3917 RepID=A0A4D6NB11_VIGUN|nr:hypothetical protein DEO72_LG10g2323 [Vigna unguiculata]
MGVSKLYSGHCLTNCVHEQRQNSASFAQASPSRLSESYRISFLVLVRVSRLGDQSSVERQVISLKREWLAQARLRRDLCVLSVNPCPGEELCVFKRTKSRSGEKSSPKRDDVGKLLFHTRSGEFTGGTLVGMSERGSSSHAQLENAMSEGVHSKKGGYVCPGPSEEFG